MVAAGRFRLAIDPYHEESSTNISFELLATLEPCFSQDGALLDLLVWKHDAVDCILSAPAVGTLLCS